MKRRHGAFGRIPQGGPLPLMSRTKAKREKEKDMEFKTPDSLKAEHKEIHDELAKATKAAERTGEAAQAVAKVLHPHFVKEEEFAMPPLSLLPALAEGKVRTDMNQVLVLTDKLKKELPEMLKEHQAIVVALQKLEEAAKAESKLEVTHLAEKLRLHAKTEEEVLYPAAVLVGEYVKVKLKK
jgi:Hemerythrin HHE cation binding domain